MTEQYASCIYLDGGIQRRFLAVILTVEGDLDAVGSCSWVDRLDEGRKTICGDETCTEQFHNGPPRSTDQLQEFVYRKPLVPERFATVVQVRVIVGYLSEAAECK